VATLPAKIKEVEKLAREAGLLDAANWIAEQRKKRWPGPGHWTYGACVWCDALDGKQRMADFLEPGSGVPTCERHLCEHEAEAEAAAGVPVEVVQS
jgi:hypothetical protein